MACEARRQRVDDHPLGSLVDLADEVVDRRALDVAARTIARPFLNDGAGRVRRVHGALEERRESVAGMFR